ncbi:YdcH family protein [Cribrihabitans sp. XS_ASV171]
MSLQKLKRRRLRIKDEMARYEGLLRTLTSLSRSPGRDGAGGLSA